MALSSIQAFAVLGTTAASTEKLTTLTIGMMEPIDSLNPFVGINDNSYIFWGLVYDYLIAVDGHMNPKPNLATSWNVVKEDLPVGSVWQYNLTHNASWHDGEPFTADDVVFTFEFQTGGNVHTLWAYQPYTKLIQSVEKVDDYTVRLHFMNYTGQSAPCSFGDAIMVPIIPKHIWLHVGAAAAGFAYENYYPIGTGPFMCSNATKDQFLKGDQLILTRNPNYHGYKDYGQKIAFDRIVLEWYLEPAAMVADVERGAIDLARFDAPNYQNIIDWISSNPNAPVGHYAGLQCTGFSVEVGINMKNTAGAATSLRLDPAVRKAMALATDKQFIVDHIYKGYGETGTGLLTPMYKNWWWSPSNQTMQSTNQWGEALGLKIPYSLDMANQTLESAGYQWNSAHTVRVSNSTNPYTPNAELKFDIVIESELTEDRDVATFLEEEYKVIGIQLNLVIVNSQVWNSMIYTPNYDLTITYWSGDPDPNYLLYVQSSHALDGWSDNFYTNDQYDQNYTGSMGAVNDAARKVYVDNCQMHTYYDVPYIVFAYPYGCYAWRTDHFSGWGNWSADPGRSFSNFYTANDLWFDLTPTGQHGATGGLLTMVGIGVVVVIALVASIMLLRRRRGGGREKDEDVRLP